VSPSAAGSGASVSLSVFCGVSSLSTRNAEGPGACVNQESSEVDAVGDKLSGDTTTVNVERFLRLF